MSDSLPIKRVSVNSSAMREVGHGMGVLEIQFHAAGCDTAKDKTKACSCSGGDVHRYPDVSPEDHQGLIAAKSIGSHFAANFRKRPSHKVPA